MRIDQILPSFGKYDAIGNDVCLLQELLRHAGYLSDVFTDLGQIKGQTKYYKDYLRFASKYNILIHHYSVGSDLPYFLQHADSFKVTRYHNITPPHYFPYLSTLEAFFRCREGRLQLPLVNRISDTFWTTSHFNAEELKSYHFKEGLVLPVLRRYAALAQGPYCQTTANLLTEDKRKTIIFVGRLLPHKSQHDLIFLLHQYHKYFSKDLRLVLVGGGDPYYSKTLLPKLINDFNLSVSFGVKKKKDFASDVIFTGTVADQELASFYRQADLFVSLSEHEGFCVPLVEAMFFGLPILAHKAAAVAETCAEGAFLVDKNEPLVLLDALARLLQCPKTHEEYRHKSLARAQEFTWEKLTLQFSTGLQTLLQKQQDCLQQN